MRIRIAVITLALLVCLSTLLLGNAKVNIQEDPVRDYITAVRAELSDGKAGLISDVMRLSNKEAEIFWPIYHKYENELFKLGDRRLEMIEQFVVAHNDKALDNAKAETMTVDWLQLQADHLELFKKYHNVISKKLSAVRAAQFIQVEHRVNTVIDIMIASELPLIKRDEM